VRRVALDALAGEVSAPGSPLFTCSLRPSVTHRAT
jgi:hypothetical protein